MQPVVRFTDARDGSFALTEDAGSLQTRRARVVDSPVTWLTQVHGAEVVAVEAAGAGCAQRADAAVTSLGGVAVSVITADCAPVLLGSAQAVAAVHAGWRGLVAGVLQNAVASLRARGAQDITAWLGPCIRSRCYEFGEADLETAVRAVGPSARAQTAWGTPALDVAAAVHGVLASVGVGDVTDSGVCTACSPVHYSHRARGDTGRQAAFIWLEP